jgi:AraC-like DNA-binding protein
MPQTATIAAEGAGWRVSHIACTDGPKDPRFAEQHDRVCIAVVLSGQFQYRTSTGEALLAPGMVLTGNPGQCFECGHDHSSGDCCLSFTYEAGFAEDIVRDVAGVTDLNFRHPVLPPSPDLIALVSPQPREAFEEAAVRLLALTAARQADVTAGHDMPARQMRMVAETVDLIERRAGDLDGDCLSLTALSQRAGINPYRYLRLFQRLTGMTPHQYVLHVRLMRAAERLRSSDDAISIVAYDAGFADLATFNRRFRKLIGQTPTVFRAGRSS